VHPLSNVLLPRIERACHDHFGPRLGVLAVSRSVGRGTARADPHIVTAVGAATTSRARRFIGPRVRRFLGPVVALLALAALSSCGPSGGPAPTPRPKDSFIAGTRQIQGHYSHKDGRLALLSYDSDKDGTIDTWAYMDAARVVRIEIDRDEDGRVDRWEYYTPEQKLEKVGWSRANDGHVDAWAYPAPDGSTARIEYAARPGQIAGGTGLQPCPERNTGGTGLQPGPGAGADASGARAANCGGTGLQPCRGAAPPGAPAVIDPKTVKKGDAVPRPPDGSPASTRIVRVEFYERGALARVEEDTDGDGRIDKWETYGPGGGLAAVAFDAARRGRPDRRLVYLPGGATRLEVDPDGSGVFRPAPAPAGRR
jgi:hypothetical protein